MTRDQNPFRYLAVHTKDVARTQLLLFAVVSLGLPIVMKQIMGDQTLNGLDVADLLRSMIGGTIMIAVLMAAGGVAGNDRKQGYYRAFFSKPMAPWWYYLQRWVLGLVAVLTIPLWLALGFQVVFGQGSALDAELFATVGLAYLLIGGAVLLFSTVTARDWLVVFLIYFMQRRMQDVHDMFARSGQELPGSIDTILAVLPPFHVVAQIGELPSGQDLVHVLLYGVAMVGIALAVMAFRPLGSGGRA